MTRTNKDRLAAYAVIVGILGAVYALSQFTAWLEGQPNTPFMRGFKAAFGIVERGCR